MGTMRYKPSDKVRIKSLDWYNENKNKDGNIRYKHGTAYPIFFTKYMSNFCGEILTIKSVFKHSYHMNETSSCEFWTDEMIECKVEEDNNMSNIDKLKRISTPAEEDWFKIAEEWEKEDKRMDKLMDLIERLGLKHEINLPEGYIIKDDNGNVINTTKIVLEKNIIREEQIDNAAQEYIDSDNAVLTYSDGFCEQTDHPFVRAAFKAGVEWADNNVTQDDCSKAPKLTSQDYSNGRFGYQLPAGFKAKLTERELILTPEKLEYPKSLLDCENVLNGIRNDRKKLLHKFNELLICRDAYWKIAGEEMGLGKPWEPDYDSGVDKFGIVYFDNTIMRTGALHRWERHLNKVLEFPTEEMRDAFYENFKEEIEQCKELL